MIIQKCVVRCHLVTIFLAAVYTAQTEEWNEINNTSPNLSFDSRPTLPTTKSSSSPETVVNSDYDPSSDIQLINTTRRSYRFESLRQNPPVSNTRNPWVRIDNSQQRESSSQSSNRTSGPLLPDKQQSLNFWQTSSSGGTGNVDDVWKSDVNIDVNDHYGGITSDGKSTAYKTVLTSSLKNTNPETNSPVATNQTRDPENQGYIVWTAGNGDGTTGWKLENIGGVARWTTINDNSAGDIDIGTKESSINPEYGGKHTPAPSDTSNTAQPESFEWKDDGNDTIFVDRDGNILKSWSVIGDGGQHGWQVVDNNGTVEWNIIYENGEWKVVSTQEYSPVTWVVPKHIHPSIIKDLESGNETVDFPYTKWDDGQTEYYVYQVEDNPDYHDYPWDEGSSNWQYPENQNFYFRQDWIPKGEGTTSQLPVPGDANTGIKETKTETGQVKKPVKNDTVNGSSANYTGSPDRVQQPEIPSPLQRKSDTPYKLWGTQKYEDSQRQSDSEKSKNYATDENNKQVNTVYNVAIPIQETDISNGYAYPQYYPNNDESGYQELVNKYDDKNINPLYPNIYDIVYTQSPYDGSATTTQSPQYVKTLTSINKIPAKSSSTEKSNVQPVPSVDGSDTAVYGYNKPHPAIFVLNTNSKGNTKGSWEPSVLYEEQIQRYNTNSWKEGDGWKTGYGSQVWIIDGLNESVNETSVNDPNTPQNPGQENGNAYPNNATNVSKHPVRPKTGNEVWPQTKIQDGEGNQPVISGWVNGYGVKTWTTTDSGVNKGSDQRKTFGFGNGAQKGIIYDGKTVNDGKSLNKGTPFVNNSRPTNKQNWSWPANTPQQKTDQAGKSINVEVPCTTDGKSSNSGDGLQIQAGVNPDRIYDGPNTGTKVFWWINENGIGIPAVWQQDNAVKRWQDQSSGSKDRNRYGPDDSGITVDSNYERKSSNQSESPQPFISRNKETNSTNNRIWKVPEGSSDSFSGWRPIIIINNSQPTGSQTPKASERKGPQDAKNIWVRGDNKLAGTSNKGQGGNSAKNVESLNRPWFPNREGTSRPRPYEENRRSDNRPADSASATPGDQKVVWNTYKVPPMLWRQPGQKSWNVPPVSAIPKPGDKSGGNGGWKNGKSWVPPQQSGTNEPGNRIEQRPQDQTDSWKPIPQKPNVQGNTWKPNGNSAGWIPITGQKSWRPPNKRQETSTANPDCDNADKNSGWKKSNNSGAPQDNPKGVIVYDKNNPDYNPPVPAQIIIITKVPDYAPWNPDSVTGENRNLSIPDDNGAKSGSPGQAGETPSGKPKPLWPPRNSKGGKNSGKSWGSGQWPLKGKSWNYVPPKRSGNIGPMKWAQDRKNPTKPSRQGSMNGNGWPNPYQSLKKWKSKQRQKLASILTSPSRSSYNWKRNVKRWLG